MATSNAFSLTSVTYSHVPGLPPVFHDLSMAIGQGLIVGVLGRSGVGKSTLLWLLKGLFLPSKGCVTCSFEPCEIVMLAQSSMALPWRRIRDNILLGAQLAGMEVNKDDFTEVIELLDLHDLLEKRPNEVSGGQLRRVLLARAVLHPHRALLLDEPLASLDAVARVEISRNLRRFLRKKTSTCVFVAHEIDHALTLADEILVLGGKPAELVFQGSTSLSTDASSSFKVEATRSAIWNALQRCD